MIFPEPLMDVDEASPSEDERAAEAFLRDYAPPHVIGDSVWNLARNKLRLISGVQEEGAPQEEGTTQEDGAPQEDETQHNVLAQHHKKNQSNQPPGLARLSTAALHQAEKHVQDDENNPQESDNEDQPEDHVRAARHSKSTGEAKPDTMAYYRGTSWWVVLTQAKIKYRRHIALNHGFPDRDQHLGDAREILLEAIEEFKGENGILDQSRFCLLYICTFTYHLVKITNQYVKWSV